MGCWRTGAPKRIIGKMRCGMRASLRTSLVFVSPVLDSGMGADSLVAEDQVKLSEPPSWKGLFGGSMVAGGTSAASDIYG